MSSALVRVSGEYDEICRWRCLSDGRWLYRSISIAVSYVRKARLLGRKRHRKHEKCVTRKKRYQESVALVPGYIREHEMGLGQNLSEV